VFTLPTSGSSKLTLLRPRLVVGDVGGYHARLECPGLTAATNVYSLGDDGLPNFFVSLAEDWRGFEGVREWGSLEGQLTLEAITADHLGHIEIAVHLRPDAGPGNWVVHASIGLDAGSLDGVARAARRFFQT
jgi:hypothetical protein